MALRMRFDVLGVGFRALQETAVASENLVQRVAGEIEETLTGVDNGIVGEGWVGDDKVLLRRLQGLDEGKVRVIEDLVGNALGTGEQAVDAGAGGLFVQEGVGFLVAEVRTDGVLEFLVLFLEESDGLLEGFQQELLADAGALGVFAVAFTVFLC